MSIETAIAVGDKVPDVLFECTDPAFHSFKDWWGKNIVLYFYPKDNTPGCTQEGRDFSSIARELAKLNTHVVGVSRDTVSCHQKFCTKLNLSFPLISDEKSVLCEFFGVVIKKNFIKKYLIGIERSTFLIDKEGVIRKIWRKVKVTGHAQEVLVAAQELFAEDKK